MRIVSLLPSTTEITAALGFASHLVGRSHECDYPEKVQTLPALTEPKYQPDGTSYEIDQRVKAILQEGLSVYRVDAQRLAELEPDVILTQDHCEACAASLPEVEQAVQEHLQKPARIISVSPTDLQGIYDSIQKIGDALNAASAADKLISEMKATMQHIAEHAAGQSSPTTVCVEWLEPLMAAGNWVPELVEIAGGTNLLTEPGSHSPWIDWNNIRKADPDFLLVMPCGYGFEQSRKEFHHLLSKPGWDRLNAVRNNSVFLLEGNQYFNRPGPRIADSTLILAEIFHPSVFKPNHEGSGWIKVKTTSAGPAI